MLDALDAGGYRLPDGPRRIGVYGHIGTPALGGLNRRANLRFGVLHRFDWVVGRGHAAASHQLDLTRAVSQLFSGSQPDLIRAVRNGRNALDLGVAQRTAQRPRELEEEAKIPMSRGLRDESARRINARTNHHAFIDSALKPEHGTANIPHRGESPHQRRLSLAGSQQMQVGGVGSHQEQLRSRRHERMPMRVNEAWHQHPPVAAMTRTLVPASTVIGSVDMRSMVFPSPAHWMEPRVRRSCRRRCEPPEIV